MKRLNDKRRINHIEMILKKLNDKKGISHIEMILSFTLFFLFVAFLLFYLNPLKNQNIGSVLINVVQQGMENKGYIYLVEVPLIITNDQGSSCFEIPIQDFFIEEAPENFAVRDNFGTNLNFDIVSDNLRIQDTNSSIYFIYTSNETLSKPHTINGDCDLLSPSDYVLNNPRIYTLYSSKRLESISREYKESYDDLKREFNFPFSSDFSVNITDIDTRTSIVDMKKAKPGNVDVKAIQVPVEVWKDGTIHKAIMNIQVW